MACLAPHFKWAPSSFSTTHAYRHPSSSSSSSNSGRCSGRRPFRVQCAVTSAVAAVVDADHAAGGPLHLVYSSPDSAPVLQRNFESTLASETVLNKEAVVTAAAAEAVALARAAAEAAQEVVHMVQKSSSQPVFRKKGEVENYLAKEILRTEMLSSRANEYSDGVLSGVLEPYGVLSDEAELDHTQDADNIAVKSARQLERRARRTRATIKAATIVRSSPKLATSSKKKRSKGPSTMNPLGSLWKMTGRKLLTAKEEVELSNGIQDLLKLEAIQGELAEYNGGQPTFPQWAAAAGTDENTLRKRLDHGIHCKNRMVTSNVRLVISIAREFEGPGLELYDLIQEGMQGLIRGAEKFDASKGFRFSTYSHWWIKQAMRKSVSEQTQIFRLPAHMVEASYRVKECTKRLRRKLKRRPSNEEIAVDTGMPVKRVEAAVNLPKYSVSLDSKIGSTDMTYQEVTADPSAETAEEMLNRMSMKKDVHQALDTLSPRERQVVKLRFGIDDGRIRTLQEIGNIMGVSRERIRQIESGAFRKLRGKKKVKCLMDYLVPVGNW
ncbi:RNA polymerase sigma factor sigB [Triticum urartu]|uniref:RNA polymerase sigma factor n=1 Tax=Triticum urartu TaxID=4572 RepID=A0A8R7U7X7_TRIUA|nr:RNA polymerase sigma factor sigB-like [Triticum dicoccoides]XP_048570712.1 RNA polymerase sigma factor sigB [Triticum urartu]